MKLLLFLFFFFLPTIVGIYVADKKNRTLWKAALISFVFGWIGVIVVCILQSKNKKDS